MSTVTEKNTKAEILKAYEVLLENIQQEKKNLPKQIMEEKQKKETLQKVSDLSSEGIVKNIAELKSILNNSLEELHNKLVGEFKQLEEIQSAIVIEKQSMEDMYELTATTDSLAAMLLAQKEKKESFEKDIAETKEMWEREKSKQKADEKEYIDELNKRRKREEEEFQYALKISRQKDKDQYEGAKEALDKELNVRKAAFEQDIANRESMLNKAETELTELRKNNAEFPDLIKQAVADKEAEITKLLKTQYDFEMKFLKQQTEAEIRLKEQTIVSLQEKIKEQQELVREYSEKTNRAEAGVKDIAVKAIENAAKTKTIERIESAKE